MNTLGNLIWLIFGGFIAALLYVVGGVVLCATLIGIPFGLQCFKLAGFVLWPFGRTPVASESPGGCLQLLCNLIWIVFGGLALALNHIFWGIVLFITIIGIPFARQHFKLVELSLAPFGKRIVAVG